MNDSELIAGIISGDESKFKVLVDSYRSLVVNTCFGFLQNKEIAHDIAQEVFIEVFLSIKKFKGESQISTWLYRIAVNKSLNHIRNNKKREIFKRIENFFSFSDTYNKEYSETEQDNDNSDDPEKQLEAVHKCINSLPENQRIAYTLSNIDKISYKEIAEITGQSLASVEGLVHRAKKNIRKKIFDFYKKNS